VLLLFSAYFLLVEFKVPFSASSIKSVLRRRSVHKQHFGTRTIENVGLPDDILCTGRYQSTKSLEHDLSPIAFRDSIRLFINTFRDLVRGEAGLDADRCGSHYSG
jgi:hypothetical protein